MNTIRIGFLLSIIFMLQAAPAIAAEQSHSAMYQMAEIMHRLKHYPSPVGKEALKKIVANSASTEREKVLATAMINLEHHVMGSDVPKLKAIIEDNGASQDERDLASMILNLNHRPTAADKARLEKMMQ
jgi:hypothetical protein